MRGISAWQAWLTAPPAITMLREAYVPVENGVFVGIAEDHPDVFEINA